MRFTSILLTGLFFTVCIHAQNPINFGILTPNDKALTVYEKDSSAHAVVLYERGDNYFEVINHRIQLVKDYHIKIKILDKKGFEHGTVSIPIYKNGSNTEKIKDLQAVTHSKGSQFRLLPSEVYTNDISEYRSEKTFTFPRIEEESILEYSYKTISPFIFNLSGWDFQSSIPKIYSEFNAKIPGNYIYNRTLIGNLKLDTNDAQIKKNCFYVEGYAGSADCEVLKYAMSNVPAFKTENEYMLSEKNYISRIDFELSEHNRLDGLTDRYTKTWKDVDHEFRNDKDIGRQLTKNSFFEKNVPENLFSETDPLQRAKNIYRFVRNHYTWNGKYGVYGKARVKEAFEEKKGSASEINMSLINLLNAAEINVNLMLISTRDSGLPKRTHPVMSDFNYCLAKVEIDRVHYLLDATDKFMPFGMLPFRALNHYGRVMDFKNESYWYNILPERNNKKQVRAIVQFQVEEGKAIGKFDITRHGYNAVSTYKALSESDRQTYIDRLESSIGENFKIVSYKLAENNNDRKIAERFSFELENVLNGDRVYINPFFVTFFKENPFLLEERVYPVDFGYGRTYKYLLSMVIPEGYFVEELPKKQVVQMEDETVTLEFLHQQNQHQVSVVFDLSLNKSFIQPDNYKSLKKLFAHVTDIQKNSLIVLKKRPEKNESNLSIKL